MREKMVHAKISQYLFPDTADFQANITSCSEVQMNRSMEKYAEAALCLLMPHRSCDDLKCTGTVGLHTRKLQEVYYYDNQAKTTSG
jgi:hypothetical protein